MNSSWFRRGSGGCTLRNSGGSVRGMQGDCCVYFSHTTGNSIIWSESRLYHPGSQPVSFTFSARIFEYMGTFLIVEVVHVVLVYLLDGSVRRWRFLSTSRLHKGRPQFDIDRHSEGLTPLSWVLLFLYASLIRWTVHSKYRASNSHSLKFDSCDAVALVLRYRRMTSPCYLLRSTMRQLRCTANYNAAV